MLSGFVLGHITIAARPRLFATGMANLAD